MKKYVRGAHTVTATNRRRRRRVHFCFPSRVTRDSSLSRARVRRYTCTRSHGGPVTAAGGGGSAAAVGGGTDGWWTGRNGAAPGSSGSGARRRVGRAAYVTGRPPLVERRGAWRGEALETRRTAAVTTVMRGPVSSASSRWWAYARLARHGRAICNIIQTLNFI